MDTSGVTNVTRMPIVQHFLSLTVNSNSTGNSKNCNVHMSKMPMPMQMQMTSAMSSAASPNAPNASPPDFDFNLPCRYFKSSFARSLSLNSANNHCKSLDYDINNYSTNNGTHSSGSTSSNSNSFTITSSCKIAKNDDYPPLPQRNNCAGTAKTSLLVVNGKNEVIIGGGGGVNGVHGVHGVNGVNGICGSKEGHNAVEDADRPPTLPARQPIVQQTTANKNFHHQRQRSLTQFRNVGNTNAVRPAVIDAAAHGDFNKNVKQPQQQQQPQLQQHHNHQQQTQHPALAQQQQQQQQQVHSIAMKRNNVWPRDTSEQDSNRYAMTTPTDGIHEDSEADKVDVLVSNPNPNPNYTIPPLVITTADTEATAPTPVRSTNHPVAATFEVHETAPNVEVVILQNQVDTLQWQLKQVETSCEMYRAVMEEVARFLDRYHSQKKQQLQQPLRQQPNNHTHTEQISRSKSLYQVYGGDEGHEKNPHGDEAPGCLRARSSTNLIDLQPVSTETAANDNATPKALTAATVATAASKSVISGKHGKRFGGMENHSYDMIAPINSYTAFKDFTWRRSPKKSLDSKNSSSSRDNNDEKLNQEAFRLSRTIHNLLNISTQQPDLMQHRNNSLSAINLGRSCKGLIAHAANANGGNELSSSSPTPTPLTSTTSAVVTSHKAHNSTLATEMLFLRSTNMRDSRLSLRSSTDSSVHSTTSSVASSSSKVETDEELISPYHAPSSSLLAAKQMQILNSATEDESGFSSISSFQDVGVPLSSTMIANSAVRGRHLGGGGTNGGNMEVECSITHQPHSLNEFNIDSRNSTLKAMPTIKSTISQQQPQQSVSVSVAPINYSTHPTNVVGVPLHSPSKTKTYHNANNKLQQRFSTLSNKDSATVLWV